MEYWASSADFLIVPPLPSTLPRVPGPGPWAPDPGPRAGRDLVYTIQCIHGSKTTCYKIDTTREQLRHGKVDVA